MKKKRNTPDQSNFSKLTPAFVKHLIAEEEAEQEILERLIAAHDSGDRSASFATLDRLARLRRKRTEWQGT